MGPSARTAPSTWPPTRCRWRSRCSPSCCSSGSPPTTSSEHTALGGRTPAQAWEQDSTLLRSASEQDLRRYLLECPGSRVIEARGVKFKNHWYTDEALQDRVGRRVELRRMPHDMRWIELYVDGQWLCRAVRQDEASVAQRQRVLDARAQAAREAAASHGERRTVRACAGRR